MSRRPQTFALFAFAVLASAACSTGPSYNAPFAAADGTQPAGDNGGQQNGGGSQDPSGTDPGSTNPGSDSGTTSPRDGGTTSNVDAAVYNTPVQCTSGTNWSSGNTSTMAPGTACRSCHALGGKASSKGWDVSGTVYPSAHEPDNCNGVNVSGASIEVTDANGGKTTLSVNSAGNFYHNDLFGFGALPKPLHVKVVYNNNVRAMVGAVNDGDCNKCHTVSGANGAPGRIMLP